MRPSRYQGTSPWSVRLFEDSDATGVNGDPSNNGARRSGAAYVFVRSGTSWSQEAYLKASNTGASDRFGSAVSMSSELVVVGAPLEDSGAAGVNGNQENDAAGEPGAVYVFVRDGTNWSQAYSKASNTDADDWFTLAVSENMLVVGSLNERSNATGVNGNQEDDSFFQAGAAHLFRRTATNWIQQAYVKASNTNAVDEFDDVVALSAGTVVVGGQGEDSGATGVNGNQRNNSSGSSGAAYVFEVGSAGTISYRNATSNPGSYSANPIVIGSAFTTTVDNELASQITSLLLAFDAPFSLTHSVRLDQMAPRTQPICELSHRSESTAHACRADSCAI